jgi:mxaJ protein
MTIKYFKKSDSHNQKKQAKYSALWATLAMACTAALSPAQANAELPETLRVCAAANEMPYSNQQQMGFENEIAQVLAKSMAMPIEFVWSEKAAIFLVSEQLLKNSCDVVIGVDSDDPRVATSQPYYTSGYVFIYPADKDITVNDWNNPAVAEMTKFAIVGGSPSEVMLREVGKYTGNFNYQKSLSGYKSPRNKYIRLDPKKLVDEVLYGKADMAHLWAPEVARYVKASNGKLEMVMSPAVETLKNGEKLDQHYAQSVAVREGDKALLDAVNKGLKKAKPKIEQILKQEGIPLI